MERIQLTPGGVYRITLVGGVSVIGEFETERLELLIFRKIDGDDMGSSTGWTVAWDQLASVERGARVDEEE